MNKIYTAALIAIAFTMGATATQARPTNKALAEAQSRISPAGAQYMRLDQAPLNTCAEPFDGGENRFDRMYNNIGPSACRSQY